MVRISIKTYNIGKIGVEEENIHKFFRLYCQKQKQ